MKNNEKLLVLFPKSLEKVHLRKDVGILPLALKKKEGWKVTIFCLGDNFSDAHYEENVDICFFNNWKFDLLNTVALYFSFIKSALRADYIMSFHGSVWQYIIFWIIKKINRRIVIYVKLDMGIIDAILIISRSEIMPRVLYRMKLLFANAVDFYSVETRSVFSTLQRVPQFFCKLYYLPNGSSIKTDKNIIYNKEKIIISVGRIGSPQKNNELLLSALGQLNSLNGYKVFFIGPVADKFKAKFKFLLKSRPDLIEHIFLTGDISDSTELESYYKRAEIFCITSIYESYGLVIAEAVSSKCYVVGTDCGAVYDLTNNGNCSSIIQVNEELYNEIIKNGNLNIEDYVNDRFEEIVDSEWFGRASYLLKTELEKIIDGKVDCVRAVELLSQSNNELLDWSTICKNLVNLYSKYNIKANHV